VVLVLVLVEAQAPVAHPPLEHPLVAHPLEQVPEPELVPDVDVVLVQPVEHPLVEPPQLVNNKGYYKGISRNNLGYIIG